MAVRAATNENRACWRDEFSAILQMTAGGNIVDQDYVGIAVSASCFMKILGVTKWKYAVRIMLSLFKNTAKGNDGYLPPDKEER